MKNLRFKYISVFLLLTGLILCSCQKDEKETVIEKTPFHSYNYLLNEAGDTIISNQFNLEDYGGSILYSPFNDILGVIAGYDREFRLWSTNFLTPSTSIRDTISIFYQIKYFTLEEMNIDYYDHGDMEVNEVVRFIKGEKNRVNKDPYKIELLYDYTDPFSGYTYTNKVAKDKFLLSEYRFIHETSGLTVELDTIEKIEARGYLDNGRWMEFLRLKGKSSGYLHNDRNSADSIYINGQFDLLFGVSDMIFEP